MDGGEASGRKKAASPWPSLSLSPPTLFTPLPMFFLLHLSEEDHVVSWGYRLRLVSEDVR